MSREAHLTYQSQHPISPSLRARLAGQVETLSQLHDWWGAALVLEATEGAEDAQPLGGSTNLLLVSYVDRKGKTVAVGDDDDAFMAWMDLCTIVDWLCERSEQHGISWSLTYMDEPVGTIHDGEEDDELALFVAELGSVVGAKFDERDDSRAQKLDERHNAR